PAEIGVLRQTQATTIVEIIIHEGRKRQIRRMFLAIGHPVIMLRRVAIDGVTVNKIPIGDFRHLTSAEVEVLYRSVRLK
ncbi:MAG TPA: pseudouridine synthase, partial [Anaerolineae bacterium]|nr:pseudouridine synthase [Anaerolineae bacterium]